MPEREVEKHGLTAAEELATVVPSLKDTRVDFCMALGGDGTILRAFSRFKDMKTPVLGINFGRIGFLSAMGPDGIPGRLEEILKGEYEMLEISLLELVLAEEKLLAVNDIVFHGPNGGSVINLGYGVDGIEVDSYLCDGMVVSTPAGSTAYNLSTGGPLASLTLDAFILTAIAPHTLRSRALILGSAERLTITNKSLSAGASVYVDGRNCGSVAAGDSADVSLSSGKARLVCISASDFYRTLRDRFIKR